MKCATHNAEAIAVCVHCGRGLCSDCPRFPQTSRMACSESCALALARSDQVIDLLLQRSLRAAKVTSQLLYLSGGCFILAGGGTAVFLHDYFLGPILFGGIGVAFVGYGIWLRRMALKQKKPQAYPDSPANGSQPIRSETNPTSPAAGSRR
jgi:hypothetical protein